MNPGTQRVSIFCRWLLVLACFLSVAQAATVEGVQLPDSVQLQGERLVLNGAGVREKFFFDIYVAGLYLPRPQANAHRILEQDQPWRMVMHFLYRKVSREKMAEGWQEGFQANLAPKALQLLQPRIDRFKSFFPTLHRGDRVILDHLPGRGVLVTINGRPAGLVEGADFARALLAIWLGDRPVTANLKRALLGRE